MEKLNNHSKGLVLAVVSAVCWGTYGTFLTLLTRVGVGQMTLVALVPTVVMIFGFFAASGRKQKVLGLRPKVMAFMLVHGLILTNIINYSYVKAVKTVPIGIVSICSFSSVIVIMITSRFLFGYSLTMHKVAAIFSALLGISLILRIFDSGRMLNLAGIGWALCIPLVSGLSSTLNRYYMNEGIGENAIMFWVNLFAAAFGWLKTPPWLIVTDIGHALGANGHPYMVVLGLAGFCLIPLVICYYTYYQAYRYIEPTYVSLCYALEPATAAVLGFMLLGQRFGGIQIVGTAIVIAAIIYIKVAEAKEANKEEKSAAV